MQPSKDVKFRSEKINDALETIHLEGVIGVPRRGTASDWQVHRGCHPAPPKGDMRVGVFMVMGMVKHGVGTSTASTALVGCE